MLVTFDPNKVDWLIPDDCICPICKNPIDSPLHEGCKRDRNN